MTTRAVGLTLVEVLVAVAVLMINLLGWLGTMQLIALLLRGTAQLLVSLEALDVSAFCPLALLGLPPRWRCSGRRAGVTLVEVLVALALTGLVFSLLAAAFGSTARFARAAMAAGEERSLRLAVPALLQQAIEVAGRGVSEGCALSVHAGAGLLALRHTTAGGVLVADEVFAAVDGGGRPALYLRRLPHPRQPWLEDVTGFRVLDVEGDESGRVVAVLLELHHPAFEQALVVHVPLPHRPCLEAAP